jgi:glutathione S-transferase
MITIHHLSTSRSERVAWLMEELGLPYELKIHAREPSGMAPPIFGALHPMSQAPVIEDNGKVLAESGAIVEYISHRYGGGRLTVPPEAPNYADYLYWLHFAEGSLMAAAVCNLMVGAAASGPSNPLAQHLRLRSERAYQHTEARLAAVPYFAGDTFTVADIMMLFPFTTLTAFTKASLDPYPAIKAYIGRIEGRPAYQKAMRLVEPARGA